MSAIGGSAASRWVALRSSASPLARSGGLYATSLGGALLLGALLTWFTGHSPGSVAVLLFDGGLRGWTSVGYSLDQATPLLLVALGTIVSNRAGQFNIGQEGQLAIGAAAAALVALKLPGPGAAVTIVALLAAALGGGLWAGLCAVLNHWKGVSIIISSLLMILVAQQLVQFCLNEPWLLGQSTTGGITDSSQSPRLPSEVWLPQLGSYPGLTFDSGLVLALALAVALALLLGTTRTGFRLRVLGQNRSMAHSLGVSAARFGTAAVVVCGALAGLAGGVVLTGQTHLMTPGVSNNMGWQGLLVALVARNNPIAAIFVAFFYGALQSGGGLLASDNVPVDLVNVIETLIVLGAIMPVAYRHLQAFRGGRIRRRTPKAV